MQKPDKYEIISELARRRGFFWPSYEIYGGVSGFLTYGPLGFMLKRRIEELKQQERIFIPIKKNKPRDIHGKVKKMEDLNIDELNDF